MINQSNDLPKPMPDSFNCLIVGQTGCGKTHLLIQMILHRIIEFDCVQLYSRSLHQKYYQFLKQLIEQKIGLDCGKQLFHIAKIIDEWDVDILLDALKDLESLENNNSKEGYFYDNIDNLPDPNDIVADKGNARHLIIFDDLIDEKQAQLSKYFTRGRHNNINVVYISQSYFHLPRKTIRNNCNLLILFGLGQRDLTNIWHDVVSSDMPIDEFKQFCSDAFEHEYGFIVIDQTADRLLKYRMGTDSFGNFADNYYVTNKNHEKLKNLI